MRMAEENASRELVLNARIAVVVQASLGLLVLAVVGVLQAMAMSERWKSIRAFKKRADRSLVWLFAMTIFGLCLYLCSMLMYTVDWTGMLSGCTLLGRPFFPLFLFASKQFLYLFLYERSCIVHDSLRLTRGRFLMFRNAILMFIVIGIPASFYWTLFVVFDAHVLSPEGFCVLYFDYYIPIIAFAGVDWVFSIFLLALFAYPLYKHIQQVSSNNNFVDDKLYQLLKRNMILSIFTTNGTFCNLVAMVVMLSYHGKDAGREFEHLQVYATFFGAWDGIVSITFCLLMTSIWAPKFVAIRIKMRTEEDIGGSRENAGSKTTSKIIETNPGSVVTSSHLTSAIVSPISDPV